MHRVLILGGSGLLGKALVSRLSEDRDIDVFTTYFKNPTGLPLNRSFQQDIGDLTGFKRVLDNLGPDIIISCLRGDFERQMEFHKVAANYLNQVNGRLYFCSTANVFDNDLSKPHYEDDPTDAESDYGIFKADCEKELKKILGENLCILRLPQIWGKDCKRIDEILTKIKNKEEIEVYANLLYNSNTDVTIAEQVRFLIKNNLSGIYHLAAEDVITHNDFYMKLINRLGYTREIRIKETLLPGEKCYLAVLSNRRKLLEKFKITNDFVIEYLSQ